MILTKIKIESQSEELIRLFPNKSIYIESDINGNILKIDTSEAAIIIFAQSKGLS